MNAFGICCTVNKFPKIPAHKFAGRKVGGPPSAKFEMHGTGVLPSCASPPRIACCGVVGAKMPLSVNKGTLSCASEIRPSYARNKKDLSLTMGKLALPPNCCRFKEFFAGLPVAV